ncbi:MAG: PQQ-binding-like beta-propeller repeat protein [Candidatus Omnitrophota bacterium]
MTSLKISIAAILIFTLVIPQPAARAATQLWEQTIPQKMTWSQVTDYGTLLVGTANNLLSINPDDGSVIWTRDDLPKTASFNARTIPGTPILLINDYVAIGAKTKIRAIDLGTGKEIWQTEPEMAYSIGMYPFTKEGIVVLFFNGFGTEKEGNGVYMRAYDIKTGAVKWQTKYSALNAFPLHLADNSGFFAKVDLSGQQEPIVDNGVLYVPFLGVDAFDLATGAKKWSAPFKTGHAKYKKSYAQPIIDGDTVYAAGEGIVYAINKASGEIRWKSEHNFGFISQVLTTDKVVFARLGGNFADPAGKTFKLVDPLGVLAIDKTTGASLWKYTGASGGITNIVYLPAQQSVMLTDATRLIGLDINETGKVRESFSVPIKFKRSMGGTEVASVGVKALTGGVFGLAKGLTKAAVGKERLDVPIALLTGKNGEVIVRGQQHILSFDPVKKEINWSVHYPAPGVSIFATTLMTALTVISATSAQYSAASGASSASSAQRDMESAWGDLDKMADRRYTASQAALQHAYVLTLVDDQGKKGVGLAGINMTSGTTDSQVYLDDKQPQYTVDEVEGKLYFFHGGKLKAFALK